MTERHPFKAVGGGAPGANKSSHLAAALNATGNKERGALAGG